MSAKGALTVVAVLVASAALLAGPAQAAPNGTYKGRTSGEVDVKVKVKKNRVTLFETSVYAACNYDSFLITFAYPPSGRRGASAKIKPNGSFKVVFKGSESVSFNDDKRSLSGKFKGGRVSGKIKVEGLCSAEATFTARK